MGRPHKCPYCGASKTVSKGVRKTKTMGKRRVRLCKACRRKFTPRNQRLVESERASAEPAAEAEVLETEEPPPLLKALDREWTS